MDPGRGNAVRCGIGLDTAEPGRKPVANLADPRHVAPAQRPGDPRRYRLNRISITSPSRTW